MSVSLFDFVAKAAQIHADAKQSFVYIPLPQDIRTKLEEIGKKVLPGGTRARDVDHITLVYIPKSESDIAPDRLERLLRELREVTASVKPIKAKVQGWAYFDGAENDGVSQTALVALLDAPGLEDLHVELKSACRRAGFEPADTHSFVPHATFAYLPRGERISNMPMLDGEFTIDKAMLANKELHELPLKRNLGEEAAKVAARVDRCKVCGKKATTKVLWAEGHGYQPACEAHKAQVAKPYKEKDDFSGFKRYASLASPDDKFVFSLSTSALRQEPRESPGKGETQPGDATTGALPSGEVKSGAHIDELQQAYKRLGPVNITPKRMNALFGPQLNPVNKAILMPGGGASRTLNLSGVGAPADAAGQRATNILGGLHEGFERRELSRLGPESAASLAFHGHRSPRVLLDESNMLSKLEGPGADSARRAFQAMRGVEGEAGEIAQAVKRVSGGRMPFRYGETALPKALKTRLAELLGRMVR